MGTISASVGQGGTNRRTDVQTVQRLINKQIYKLTPLARLVPDGKIGALTLGAIREFQKRVVGFAEPDGRVDPGGQTIAALTGQAPGGGGGKPPGGGEKSPGGGTIGGLFPPPFAPEIPGYGGGIGGLYPGFPGFGGPGGGAPGGGGGAPGGGGGAPGGGGGGGAPGNAPVPIGKVGNAEVVFSDKLPQADKTIVNAYSVKVIAMCMDNAGVAKGVITSTIRSVSEQIGIMYRNAKINLAGQYELYGSAGDKVLKVYEDNKDKPEAEVKALMIAEAERLAKAGSRVSLHVVPESVYKTRNIIDVGVNSTRTANGGTINVANITKAFRDAETDGYIAKFIDETNKSNTCWHVEIKPNAKALPG